MAYCHNILVRINSGELVDINQTIKMTGLSRKTLRAYAEQNKHLTPVRYLKKKWYCVEEINQWIVRNSQ